MVKFFFSLVVAMVATGTLCFCGGSGDTVSPPDDVFTSTDDSFFPPGDNQSPDNSFPDNILPDGVQLATLKIDSDPQGADIYIDDEYTGKKTPAELMVTVGFHKILLKKTGFVQYWEMDVPQEGVEVEKPMLYDLTGTWVREIDGTSDQVKVSTASDYDEEEWNMACPTATLFAGPFSPFSGLCLEPDNSLSLCKNYAEGCETIIEDGKILDDGTKIEFTFQAVSTGKTQKLSFKKKL